MSSPSIMRMIVVDLRQKAAYAHGPIPAVQISRATLLDCAQNIEEFLKTAQSDELTRLRASYETLDALIFRAIAKLELHGPAVCQDLAR